MASLVVIEGQQQGRHFPLTTPLVSVGRDDTCTIQILDAKISRKHLQIRLEAADKRHFAGDYRSANGVFVNNKQIVGDVPLADGDRVRIGSTTLMYLAADHADEAAANAAARKKEDEWQKPTILGGG